MAEILGLGCTHRPVMLRRDEDWTLMMRASLDDPDMPAEMKDPLRWPAQLRDELAEDFGAAAAGRAFRRGASHRAFSHQRGSEGPRGRRTARLRARQTGWRDPASENAVCSSKAPRPSCEGATRSEIVAMVRCRDCARNAIFRSRR